MYINLLCYKTTPIGKFIKSTKLLSEWELNLSSQPLNINLYESLITDKLRVVINSREVFFKIMKNEEKKRGIRIDYLGLSFEFKKNTSTFELSVNGFRINDNNRKFFLKSSYSNWEKLFVKNLNPENRNQETDNELQNKKNDNCLFNSYYLSNIAKYDFFSEQSGEEDDWDQADYRRVLLVNRATKKEEEFNIQNDFDSSDYFFDDNFQRKNAKVNARSKKDLTVENDDYENDYDSHPKNIITSQFEHNESMKNAPRVVVLNTMFVYENQFKFSEDFSKLQPNKIRHLSKTVQKNVRNFASQATKTNDQSRNPRKKVLLKSKALKKIDLNTQCDLKMNDIASDESTDIINFENDLNAETLGKDFENLRYSENRNMSTSLEPNTKNQKILKKMKKSKNPKIYDSIILSIESFINKKKEEKRTSDGEKYKNRKKRDEKEGTKKK